MPSNLRKFPVARIARTVTELPAVEQYWTIEQVAERLHSGVSTVKSWLASNRLQKRKAGRKTLIAESAIQAFLEACTSGK